MLSKIGFQLGKSARLSNKKVISDIFKKGNSLFTYPIKLLFVPSDPNPGLQDHWNIQVAFSVSKKNFKSSVDRNKIKRLCREAYRIQSRAIFNPTENLNFRMTFIYIGKQIEPYSTVEKAFKKLLFQIKEAESK